MLKNAIWLFVLSVIILGIFVPSYTRMQDLEQKNKAYLHEIKQLAAERDLLREERRLLEEDPAYLEKVAREKMGLIREGEVIYKITPVEE